MKHTTTMYAHVSWLLESWNLGISFVEAGGREDGGGGAWVIM